MTELREAVKVALERLGGNIAAVARDLGVSEEYVRRVKLGHYDSSLVLASRQGEVWPCSDVRLKAELVDVAVRKLIEWVEGGELGPADVLRLLEVVLRYEVGVIEALRPMLVNVSHTVSAVHDYRVLVEKLEQLPVERLKEIVDGELITEGGDKVNG